MRLQMHSIHVRLPESNPHHPLCDMSQSLWFDVCAQALSRGGPLLLGISNGISIVAVTLLLLLLLLLLFFAATSETSSKLYPIPIITLFADFRILHQHCRQWHHARAMAADRRGEQAPLVAFLRVVHWAYVYRQLHWHRGLYMFHALLLVSLAVCWQNSGRRPVP